MFIFLFGKDAFRSKEKVRQLKEKFLEKNGSGSGLSVLDFGEKLSAEAFREALSASGLFSQKRLVIAENLLQEADAETQKSTLSLLKQRKDLAGDKDLVVVFWEKGEPRKNNALYKFLLSEAKKQSFAPLEGKLLSDWIVERLARMAPETKIDAGAISLLCVYTSNDPGSLETELGKLSAYKPAGTISKDDVFLLVKSQASMTIFDTIEALASGNKKRALELLHQQLSQGEDAFYILSMYAYQLRNLLKIGDAFWNGVTNQYAIAKETGLHPFVVQKGIAQLRHLTPEKLKKMFSAIQKIDQEAKTGKTDLALALDIFIASL